jgi:hypothetical protein
MGIRLALGAGRCRLVRQLLTEAPLLVALAGLAGLAVARWVVDLVVSLLYSTLPSVLTVKLLRLPDLGLDHRVVVHMFFIATATVAGAALARALQATRWGAALALRRQSLGVGSGRLRDALVVGQAALWLTLLVCAG